MAQAIKKKPKEDDWVDVSSDESDWKDVTPEQPKVETKTQPIKSQSLSEVKKDPSFLESVWNTANQPLTNLPSRVGRKISAFIDPSHGSTGLRSTASAFAESLGDTLSGLSSPLNVALTAATAGSGMAAKAGLGGIAEGLATTGKVLSAPVAAHGAYKIATGETLPEKLMGGVELVGGGLGLKGSLPKVKSNKVGKIADQVIKPEEIPHDFNEGIDFTDIPNELPREFNLHNTEVLPESRGANVPVTYDPYSSILEKQGRGELRSRPSEVPPVKQEMVPTPEIIPESTIPIETGEIPPNMGETLEQYQQRTKLEPNKAKEIYDTYETTEPNLPNEFIPPEAVKHTELQPTDDIQSALEQSLTQSNKSKTSIEQVKETIPNEQIPASIAKTVRDINVAKMAPGSKEQKEGLIRKTLDASRTLMTAFDLSAPLRQGRPLMHTKEWFTSLDDMFKSLGQKGYDTVQQSIREHPSGYFEPKISSTTGKVGKSFAEESGLSLTDVLDNNEEVFRSKWAEKIPGVKPSNRAFVGFLNKLRSDTFANMVDLAKQQGKNPETDKVLAKQIADFVNMSTGRGNLGRLEPIAKELADGFFAPRLIASKIQRYGQVLNPKFYTEMDPMVRSAQLKSLLATAGTGLMMGEAAKLAGAEVNNDPTNTDFRKIKIGDTRLDVFGGDQQYLVAAARLLSGKSTSSISGKTTDLTAGRFGQKTRSSVAEDFFTQKLAPLPSFVWAWMKGRDFDGTPFEMKKALLQRTVPIVAQDLEDLIKKEPNLAPQIKALLAASAVMGSGVQTYGR